jgi:hypothetical protein
MLPNIEKASVFPSGDQDGSTAPHVVVSFAAASVTWRSRQSAIAAMANTQMIAIRAAFMLCLSLHQSCSM